MLLLLALQDATQARAQVISALLTVACPAAFCVAAPAATCRVPSAALQVVSCPRLPDRVSPPIRRPPCRLSSRRAAPASACAGPWAAPRPRPLLSRAPGHPSRPLRMPTWQERPTSPPARHAPARPAARICAAPHLPAWQDRSSADPLRPLYVVHFHRDNARRHGQRGRQLEHDVEIAAGVGRELGGEQVHQHLP